MSDVRSFGAVGDGVADDTEAIRHALEAGDGVLEFPPGSYRVTRTISVPLRDRGSVAITGFGGSSRIVAETEGPALRILGNHRGTGDPLSITAPVFEGERAPLVRDILIDGATPNADGIELKGVLQCSLQGVVVRRARHGIRLTERNRNLILSGCHLYHNRGVGLYFDQVNLHQINVTGCHISYNRMGGIRIEGSEVRNLQITGNDIEYNNARTHAGLPQEPTAEIWIDTTGRGATVNEVTICSNTIQATVSPGGSNLRILEKPGTDRPPGLWTITGNVIGSQERNVWITGAHGITLTGNTIYSAAKENLLVEHSDQIVAQGNHFRRHTPDMGTGVSLVASRDVTLGGMTIRDESETGQKSGLPLLRIEACDGVLIHGGAFIDGVPYGIEVQDSRHVRLSNVTVRERRTPPQAAGSIRFRGPGANNLIAYCDLELPYDLDSDSGVDILPSQPASAHD